MGRISFKCFVFVGALLISGFAQAAVWQNTNQWNADWELRYQEWVKTHWNTNYFFQPGPYKNMEVNCADAVYSMRFIFAEQNGLPFVIKDSSGRGTISNSVSRFDHIADPDMRKRAFLEKILAMTGTYSLPNDTYFIPINRQYFTPGILLLTDRAHFHSWTMADLSDYGTPHMIFGSLPAKTRLVQQWSFPLFGSVYSGAFSPATKAGWRAFRQPQYIGMAESDVPGYSLDQFTLSGTDREWSKDLQHRLKLREETLEETASRYLKDTCESATARVGYVNSALNVREGLGGHCMNSSQYENYSTPSKDKRMRDMFQQLQNLVKDTHSGTLLSAETGAKFLSVLSGDGGADKPDAFCRIRISSDRSMSLGQVMVRALSGRTSSNPNDSLLARWGLDEGARTACPSH